MPEFLAADLHTTRRNDELVIVFLDDVAADLTGDLLEFVGDMFHHSISGRLPGNIGDDDVAVVDRVLDFDYTESRRKPTASAVR